MQFGSPPNRIDILTTIAGLKFDTAWADRVESEVEGVTIPFLGREQLIASKRAAGRKKDLSDLEALRAD